MAKVEQQTHTVKYQLDDEGLVAAQQKPDLVAQLMQASEEADKSTFAMIWEWFPLLRGPGKLNFQEYLDYRLFDEEHTPESRRQFITDRLHWNVVNAVDDKDWHVVSEDKWLMDSLLAHHGIPLPHTVAIVHDGSRGFGTTPTLTSLEEVRDCFAEHASGRLFLKPVLGIQSRGAMLVTGFADDTVELFGGGTVALEQLFATMQRRGAYLVQRVIENHPTVAAWARNVATVRLYNFLEGGALRHPAAIHKVPGGDNVADNFWREGNILCDLDPASGRIRRAVRGMGLKLTELKQLPGHEAPVADLVLPHWDEVLAVNAAAARLYSAFPYSSSDIAITPDGPVIIEFNVGGSFVLPQIASGRGFLTDDHRAFFERHGATF